MTNALSTSPILTAGDLSANAASYARHLRAANLSPSHAAHLLDALSRFAAFLIERGMPTDVAAISREHVEESITDQLTRLSAGSAANRYLGLRPFFNWLVEEGELR